MSHRAFEIRLMSLWKRENEFSLLHISVTCLSCVFWSIEKMQNVNFAVVDAVFALYILSVPRTKTARQWPICEMADRGSWASDGCGCCGIQPWLLILTQLFFPICPWQQETKCSWCWPMVRKLCIHKQRKDATSSSYQKMEKWNSGGI